MRNLKFIGAFFLASFFYLSCSVNTQDVNKNKLESSSNLELDISQEEQRKNLSTVSRAEYDSMDAEEKQIFQKKYVNQFRNGGGCTCNACCSIECPSGTKPNCQCGQLECSCQCEPYGRIAIEMKYKITDNKDGSKTLMLKKGNAIDNFLKSTISNREEIADLFKDNDKLISKEVLQLSSQEYYEIEAKFQKLTENYSIEEVFMMEYKF